MKYIFLPVILLCFAATVTFAQTKEVTGVVTDSTKTTLPGSTVFYKTEAGDSSSTVTNVDGKFTFPAVKGLKMKISVTSLGYRGVIKNFALTTDPKISLPPIVLKEERNELKEVTIVGINPVKFTEDTVAYSVAAYKVRDNAPVEDVLKKVPGVDVDANGNVTAQGQSVTKVRINGKDFMGGDVQSATKNLPADILESIQVIDDYGDQANLTGVKTGTPNKILNFVIRADRNYGYSLNMTAGGGEDLLPSAPGITNDARYLGLVNLFDFKGDRQLTILGNLNNTNVNTFNFSSNGGGGGGGGGGSFGGNGGNGGAGGGRGNAQRGGNANGALATVANGITNARSIGANYRNQYGKTLSVYGSYSFADNTTYTASTTLQTNNFTIPTSSNTNSQEHDNPINHRFTLNAEWRPDTLNYLKVTPTFSYASTNTTESETTSSTRNGAISTAYTLTDANNSQTPTIGATILFNHHFRNRNNLSINLNLSTAQGTSYDNPIYHYTAGIHSAPAYQIINQNNTTTSISANVDYLQHLGKVSYLDFNYTYSYSYTSNDKETDTLSSANTLNNYALLSNNFKYTFTTNKFVAGYRVVEQKYNYTVGVGLQPATLDGQSITNNTSTHKNELNFVPTANFIYNFSRNQNLRINYNGSSSQPTFQQLQPVYDFSSALYPVVGNPDLKPQFQNSVSVRYQNFGIASGNLFFVNLQYSNTSNAVVSKVSSYGTLSPAVLSADPSGTLQRLQNTSLTQYVNSNGFYNESVNFTFAKPWNERRYTIYFTGAASYQNNLTYTDSVDVNNIHKDLQQNVAKTLTLSPATRFRVDITDVMDAQVGVAYSLQKVDNSISNSINNLNTNIRSIAYTLNGKQYIFKDWTFDYDFTKVLYQGYAASENVRNPNVLNGYLERRFLKNHAATIRLSVFDVFNQNAGYTTTVNGASVTQQNVNRLGRYYLATFTLRLQKFAGRAPTQNNDRGNRGPGGPGGGPGGRGGFGGGPGGGMGGPPSM
jgi:hypothetical protein